MAKDFILYEDALKIANPVSFNLMLKPVGAACNLDCTYCYYKDKDYGHGIMDDETLELSVKGYLETAGTDEVTFNWHGGEPLLAGREFYRKALLLQKKYSDGRKINNTIQTNGILIDREWAEFLAENDFLTGLSLDGPQDIHDRYRRCKTGNNSFERVIRGLEWLKRAGVRFNTMTVISKASEGRGGEVYQFLKHVGSRYMQFMPAVEFLGNRKGKQSIVDPSESEGFLAPWSVSAEGFGRFMCDVFDCWVKRDVGQYFVGLFDATLAGWCGMKAGTCIYGRTCGENCLVECNGDIYPCDHFVYDKFKEGNIRGSSLRSVMNSFSQIRFGQDKCDSLPDKCNKCPYLHLCWGECPKHRLPSFASSNPGENVLCDGYSMFFAYVQPYMLRMRTLLESGQPPALIMQWDQ